MAQKRKLPSPEDDGTNNTVFQSSSIEDRSSTFTGYFSPTLPPKELQGFADIKSASHKILAWRKESAQRSLTPGRPKYIADNDDDGEKYGGKTVQKVLERMDVVGACVVARWYGGVMLGQVRFTHMETCAREAVQKWRDTETERTSKKQRLEHDEIQRQSLLGTLAQRDQSILVLRTLAVEKEGAVKCAILAGVEDLQEKHEIERKETKADVHLAKDLVPSSSPAVPPDYTAMPMERLRALERARDATLSFLLKRITKAEADLGAINSPRAA